MTISTVTYCETIFEHTDLTKITGVLTYDNLHLLHKEIKANAMAVQSNLGGGQHVYIGLVVRPTDYALLTNTPFVSQVYTGNLRIPIAATRHTQE